MSLSVDQSVFVPICSGKVDRKNPEKRVVQKGSTQNRCLFYALNMLRPRGPWDPQWTPEMRDLEKQLSPLRRGIAQALDWNGLKDIRTPFVLNVLKKEPKELYFNNTIQALFQQSRKDLEAFLPEHFKLLAAKIIEKRRKELDQYYKESQKEYEEGALHSDALAVILDHFYLKGFKMRISEWSPLKSLGDLIGILKKDGPFTAAGLYGSLYYKAPAKGCYDPVVNASQDRVTKTALKVFGWGPGQRCEDIDPEDTHMVVICGASKISSQGTLHERVYFVDPNDSSDPKVEGFRKTYVMSFETFVKYSARGTVRMSFPTSVKEIGVYHGIHAPSFAVDQSGLEGKKD